MLRIVAYVLLAGALLTPVVQFQYLAYRVYKASPEAKTAGDAKDTKGAIWRWRLAVREFWAGQNIYQTPDEAAKLPVGDRQTWGNVWLHPNMPFTVMLMTPFAYMPVLTMTLVYNLLKVLVILASILMAVRIANHQKMKMPDWVVGLGVAYAVLLLIGDMQHGNTNVFVLGAVVCHLWLYRRGRDVLAGIPLALGICLKMTPAIFILYWLYQRNWKLLAGTLAALALFAVAIPAAAVPDRYATLTRTWLDNLIIPGLVKGEWYPIHINQSLPGVASRYLLGEPQPGGNIFWNPDDNPYAQQNEFRWIALASLEPATVKVITRIAQLVLVGLMAWAIGWRKLPRDDGRRALHYGLVVLAMMLLNQRTWDHHATVLLIADVAIWYGIAFGRISPGARKWALGLAAAAGPLVLLTGTDFSKAVARLFVKGSAKHASDIFNAYGPVFLHFLLMFIAGVVLLAALRKASEPYSAQRQKLGQSA